MRIPSSRRRLPTEYAVSAVSFRSFHQLEYHGKRIADAYQDRLPAAHFLEHGTPDQLLLFRGKRKISPLLPSQTITSQQSARWAAFGRNASRFRLKSR